MEITGEQEKILLCEANRIAIQAYAGSGKTEILRMYAQVHKKKKFLYLCFNKDAQTKASKRFGSNVSCRTIDSLCFEVCGARGKTPVSMNVKLIKEECPSIADNTGLCFGVLNALKKFCSSSTLTVIGQDSAPVVRENAQQLWEEYCNNPLTTWTCHEMNRKHALMQVDETVVFLSSQFDCIMVDECQDLNPVMLAIVEAFPGRVIYVGDTHQAIYSFMGNVNAFKLVKSDEQFVLPKSFRFGKAIADYATRAIREVKGVSDGEVIGNSDIKSSVLSAKDVKEGQQVTFLARINKTIFYRAHQFATKGYTIHWNGMTEYVAKILELLKMPPEKWEYKKNLAEEEHDAETVGLMQIVEAHGSKTIEEMISKIKSQTVNEDKADYVLSTVHKAKGLEWDLVLIESDLKSTLNRALEEKDLERYNEECNIYYVAITRAKKGLIDESGILSSPPVTKKRPREIDLF